MAILSKEDFFAALHARVSEDKSEDGITFLENMTDTYLDLENRANGSGEDWKAKYEALDESWKERYRHRFFSGSLDRMQPPGQSEEKDGYKPEEVTFDSIFKKKGS